MRRILIRSSAFFRAANRLLKKRPDVAEDLRVALKLLSEDALKKKNVQFSVFHFFVYPFSSP